jgi:hypothetical protein
MRLVMRLARARGGRPSNQVGWVSDLHRSTEILIAMGWMRSAASIMALPPGMGSPGRVCSSVRPGDRLRTNVLPGRYCGNKPSPYLISIKKAPKKPWQLLSQQSQSPTGA